MGEEILGADGAPKQIEVNEGNAIVVTEMDGKTLSNMGKEPDEPANAGSMDNLNGANGNAKEADKLACLNVPKDAADEWPEQKKIQIHSFYFIRFRPYEDPQLKAKIELSDKDLQKKNQARYQIIESLKAKRSERSNLRSELQPFLAENKKYREAMEEKKKEMQPLQEDLRKFRTANNAARERGVGLCSSEEELNDLIKSLHYRIQHESNTLNEEKKLLKEIKQLEATREKVIANAAMKVEIEGSKDQKAAIQDRVKLIGFNMDDVRKEKQAVMASIKQLDEELKAIDSEIESLEEELRSVTERRDKAFEALTSLRKARDEANACFYQNRSLLNNARELAARKDVTGLKALWDAEVEKFMLQWNTDKTFRDDYERRILTSLDSRQLSRDGRMRNPDEKPIIVEAPSAAKAETVPVKIAPKPSISEDVVSSNATKGEEELVKSTKADVTNVKDTEEIGKSREASRPKEVDPAKLKEMKREEEIAKARLALERKKKLAEKAAAKAAAKAQKEAEKKLKEKEKKAKKKAGPTELAAVAEPAEAEEDKAAETDEADVKTDEKLVTEPRKERPKGSARNRKMPQPKPKNQLPRAILKKKKSQSYMYWAVPAAILSLVLVAVLGYYIFGKNLRA